MNPDDLDQDDDAPLGPSGPVGHKGEVVRFESRGAIIKAFECRDNELLLSGPAGTGKSRGCLEKIHYLLSTYAGAKALLLRKTLVSLTESGLLTYRNQVLHQLDGVTFFGGSKQEPARFNYPNGATATVGGLDRPTKVMSSDYDFIYVQELNELVEGEYEYLTTRLRNGAAPFQQLISDINPQEPWHWVLKRAQRGTLTMFESRHEENPKLFEPDMKTMTPDGAAYLGRLDNLTGVRYLRLRKGIWAAAEGQVYDDFDSTVHVVKPFKIPSDWTRIRSVDFGFVNPFVCQWWAVDNDGRMYLYREWYRTKKIVADHAKRIKELSGNQLFVATVADHDSEDRATLHANGIPTVRAKKQIVPGIEAVQKRLRLDEAGRPRLYIFENALVNREEELAESGQPTCLVEEMQSYAWPKGKPDQASKELPVDLNNHACFVAGTPILTASGFVPIESVHVGDLVWTRRGLRRVVSAGLTADAASIYRAAFASGAVLRATGNHPVLTGRGWISIDALRYSDTCLAVPAVETPHMPSLSPSSSTGAPTGVTRTPRGAMRSISRRRVAQRSIETCGHFITARFRRVTISTTGTSTPSTMSPGIWNAFRRKTIWPVTHWRQMISSAANNVLRPSAHSRLYGTDQTPEERGIGSTRRRALSTVSPSRGSAIDAARASIPWVGGRQTDFALAPVRRRGDVLRALMTRLGHVPLAARSTPPIDILGPALVPVHVRGVSVEADPQPVYNLAVEGDHEFIAGGIVVHNCDAMRYAVMYLEKRHRGISPGGSVGSVSKWVGRHSLTNQGLDRRGTWGER